MILRSVTPTVVVSILTAALLWSQDAGHELADGVGAIPEDARTGYEALQASSLKTHLTILASDSLGGRGNGQPGLRMAAEYLAAHYRQLGLSPLDDDSSFFQLGRHSLNRSD